MSIVGILLDFGLALPFAIALALHNQIFQRPNFHLAACYAAIPLIATSLIYATNTIIGIVLMLGVATAVTIVIDTVVSMMDRSVRKIAISRSFFASVSVYLILIQLILLAYGASPRTFDFSIGSTIDVGGLSVPALVLYTAIIGASIAIMFQVFFDGILGSKLRLTSGENIDANLLGLPTIRYQRIALISISSLVTISSLSKALVVPFSAYSSFNTYILCFCAATLPFGSKIFTTTLLIFSIYLLRGTFAYYFSSSAADALTLIISLAILTIIISQNSLVRTV